jgi:hypothetical protein
VKNSLIILLIFLGQNQLVNAQTNVEKIIIGTVVSDAVPLKGISVINCSNKMMAVSDENGCFSILAKNGDVLNFSGIDYKYLMRYIYKNEYKQGVMEVDMVFNSVELDEVIVNKYANITAENLGIIPRGQVKLTEQERKLYSSSGGILGLFSSLSGEREMLKMNVEIEKKESLLKKMGYLFADKYYIKTLKIPEESIRGFQYYCIEDSGFVTSLNSKNKTMSMFLMVELALNYNQNRITAFEKK